MDDENEIGLETIGSVTVLDIRGDVTVASETPLNVAYEKATKQGADEMVLKFHENVYINSGGIATLLQMFSRIKTNNQQIAIAGLSEHFKKIFNMVGITKFANIYGSVDEAREGLSK